MAGVDEQAITADYDLSAPALVALFAAADRPGDLAEVTAALAHHAVSTQDVIRALLADFDAASYLRAAGSARRSC